MESTGFDDTVRLGEQLGKNALGGEVIELVSDLGGGKTALTTGLALGIGSQDVVSSPTFTISRVYYGLKLTMHHFDFYRLPEPGLVAQQLQEVCDDPSAVVVVEWGGSVESSMPDARVVINIQKDPDLENVRIITASYPPKYDYLFEGLATLL